MNREKVVCIYGDANAAANDSSYLDVLVNEIGLNRIIFGGGFNLSAKTRALNPIKNGGAPGLGLVDDDKVLHKGIEEAHKKGIQVWVCIGGWAGGAEQAPEYMAYDLNGTRMDLLPKRLYAHEQAWGMFCPNNERVNAWLEAALGEIAARYDFQGSAITHARYPHSAAIPMLLGCACETCQKKAIEFGYDFQSMKSAVFGAFNALKHLTAADLKTAAKVGIGFIDFLQILGKDADGVIDWFNFRADGITNSMRRFSNAVHAARPDFLFGTDTHYPTMALLVGHRYSDLVKICDQIVPLLSHNEIHFMDNVGSYSNLLLESVENLSERDAVRLVYNFLGIHTPNMPRTVKDMKLGNPLNGEIDMQWLGDLIANEMYKTRLISGSKVLSYPVIKGSTWPEKTVRRLMQVSLEAGHDGIVFQGTDSLFKPKK